MIINSTLNVPKSVYPYNGLCSIDVPGGGPSPKSQSQAVITPPRGDAIVERSVNCVLNPTHTVSTVNNAVGFGLTTITLSHVSEHPLSSVTINVTV